MSWYDAHCHLPAVAQMYDFPTLFTMAEENGVQGWLSNALNKEELRWHQLNRHPKIIFSAGIHPFYNEGTPFTLDDLEVLARDKQVFAIGEIGLDKRNRDLNGQVKLLKDQISLARAYDLPCVFHVVGHLDVFYKVLSDLPVRGIWHGYNGSRDAVRQFSRFDLTFSIGQALVSNLKHEIINSIIDTGNFLIETDAPYNVKKPDPLVPTKFNPLMDIIGNTRTVSKLHGVKVEAMQNELARIFRQYLI